MMVGSRMNLWKLRVTSSHVSAVQKSKYGLKRARLYRWSRCKRMLRLRWHTSGHSWNLHQLGFLSTIPTRPTLVTSRNVVVAVIVQNTCPLDLTVCVFWWLRRSQTWCLKFSSSNRSHSEISESGSIYISQNQAGVGCPVWGWGLTPLVPWTRGAWISSPNQLDSKLCFSMLQWVACQ